MLPTIDTWQINKPKATHFTNKIPFQNKNNNPDKRYNVTIWKWSEITISHNDNFGQKDYLLVLVKNGINGSLWQINGMD